MPPIHARPRTAIAAASVAVLGAVALAAAPVMAATPDSVPTTPYVPVTHTVTFDPSSPDLATGWTVPADITTATVTLSGGNGGANRSGIDGIPGGTGATIKFALPVTAGEKLTTAPGLAGANAGNVGPGLVTATMASGGNGGFGPFRPNPLGTIFGHGGAGGSATTLFTAPSGSATPELIAVAGGGGGAGGNIGGSSVSQGGMGGSATLVTANDGDPGPSGDEGCGPAAGGTGGGAAGMPGSAGEAVGTPAATTLGAGGGGGGGYRGGLGGASGDHAATGCSQAGGGGGAGTSLVPDGVSASDAPRPAGTSNGQVTIEWTDPTPTATLSASSSDLADGEPLTLTAAATLLPPLDSPEAVFAEGNTVLGLVPLKADSSATLTVPHLAPGSHALRVSIVDGTIEYAVSTEVVVTVEAAPVETTAAPSGSPTATTMPSTSAPVATATTSVPASTTVGTAPSSAAVPATTTQSPAPGLAQTGATSPWLMAGSAALLLLAGGILVFARRGRHQS